MSLHRPHFKCLINHANVQQRFQLLTLHHFEIVKGHHVIAEKMTVS